MNPTLLEEDVLADTNTGEPVIVVINATPRQGRVKVVDLARDGVERWAPVHELVNAVLDGELRLRRDAEVAPALMPPPGTADSERYAAKLAWVNAVRELMQRRGLTVKGAHEVFQANPSHPLAPPSPLPPRSTLYRAMARDTAGQPLLRGDKCKGNRTPRYPAEVVDIVVTAAKKHLLLPDSPWTFKTLTELINERAKEQGLCAYGVSRRYVQSTVLKHCTRDVEKARMQPVVARAAKAVAKGRVRANRPFERVEQDALHLPWHLMTSHGLISGLYLVHAIDCSTGQVVGWRLCTKSPTTMDTLACVESILFPKADLFHKFGITTDIYLHGVPSEILLDNGPENKGERVQQLAQFGINVTYCRARSPQEKPYIERLNRSLKEGLSLLPGCTRMDGVDGMRDPMALGDKILTLDEFEQWLVRWYHEVWAHTPLKRLADGALFEDSWVRGATPHERWKHCEEHGLLLASLPPARDRWARVRYIQSRRALSRKSGVSLEGFTFAGPNLPRLLDRFGENLVTVFWEPEDFRAVHVADGDELVTLVNTAVDEGTPAYSFAEGRELVRSEMAKPRHPQLTAFKTDLLALATRSGKPPAKSARPPATGAKATTHAVQLARRHADAVEQAKRRPLPKPTRGEAGALDSSPDAASQSFDLDNFDLEALPVVNRKTGENG